jgi:hypothetical protein
MIWATILANPLARGALIALAAVLAFVAYTAWQRQDAAHDAVQDVKIEAATQEQETRREGDKAAADAERSGADQLLREGRF